MTPKCYSYIRFSTPEQAKGDSLRRQMKMGDDYATKKGLVLDTSLRLHDLGMSAYKGEHKGENSALGKFLGLIELGKVATGSMLIVESLDRLSREHVLKALNQFLAIIQAGVTIVTLADEMEYSTDSINDNFAQLIISLTIMSRAHEESQQKAKRLKAAWDAKRANVTKKKLTSICPEWLKLNVERTAFEIIEPRAEIVRRIYKEKLAGKGTRLIEKELNQQNVWLPKSRKRTSSPAGWRASYILKILKNPAVIGEFQPRTTETVNGKTKKVPAGDPIKDYYPAVVPLDLYHAVQNLLAQTKALSGNGGGRNGKISNLFGHIAKCGYCGSSMHFENKGKPPRGGKYLVCSAANRGLGECKKNAVRYDEFEELVLTYCKRLNPSELLPGHEEQETILQELEGNATVLAGQLKEEDARISNLTDSIATTENPAVRNILEERLADELSCKDDLQANCESVEREIAELRVQHENTEARIESVKQLLSYLKETTGDELIGVRLRLRQEMRNLIDWIKVYPVGQHQMTPALAAEFVSAILDVQPELAGTEELEKIEADLLSRIDNRELRRYTIRFKGGSFTSLCPATPHKMVLDFDRDASRLINQFVSKDGEIVKQLP